MAACRRPAAGRRSPPAGGRHQVWPDEISLRDESRFDAALVGGHRQLTDAYLPGLAQKRGGRLATFDRTVPFNAVVGATAGLLAIITPAPVG